MWQFRVGLIAGIGGVFCAAFVLYPLFPGIIAAVRRRWRTGYTAASLGAAVAGLTAFILHFGNRQFGGFDHSIMISVGWRLVQGQIPYRDFTCTLPPGFFLPVEYAFRLFGIRWTSILLAEAILAAVSFPWMYYLLRALLGNRLLGFLTALSVQFAAVLIFSYWWYNSVTTVAATLLFLSCLLYLKEGPRAGTQISYVASLALTGLMKPNVAGPVICVSVILLFLAMPSKIRVLALSAAATAVALAILALNHVSVAGMISSYFMVLRQRGAAQTGGFYDVTRQDQLRTLVLLAPLLLPYLAWWPPFREAIASRDRRRIAFLLLLLAALGLSSVAMKTNGDIKDVEWPLVICSGVLLLREVVLNPRFGARWTILVRVYACALLVLAFADLYLGATRYRVLLIGQHNFFEWQQPLPNPGTSFFAGMRASPRLHDAMTGIAQALQKDPGTTFFGPRLDFAYAAFRLPPPKDLPIWWDPGTAYAREDDPAMIEVWRQRRFQTFICLDNDTTFYSPLFVKLIESTYTREDRLGLWVFHRKGDPSQTGAPR
jgi:hypothetical protein